MGLSQREGEENFSVGEMGDEPKFDPKSCFLYHRCVREDEKVLDKKLCIIMSHMVLIIHSILKRDI